MVHTGRVTYRTLLHKACYTKGGPRETIIDSNTVLDVKVRTCSSFTSLCLWLLGLWVFWVTVDVAVRKLSLVYVSFSMCLCVCVCMCVCTKVCMCYFHMFFCWKCFCVILIDIFHWLYIKCYKQDKLLSQNMFCWTIQRDRKKETKKT